MKRNVSRKTSNILYALSGNQCAHPDCTESLIEEATGESDAQSKGEICHIYSVSEAGPRGRSGLTETRLNSLGNLILLCRNHHSVVDGQHESFPASLLMGWKHDHQEKMKELQVSESLKKMRFDRRSTVYQIGLLDEKIKEAIDRLRRSHHFSEFDSVKASIELGRRLIADEFKDGSSATRVEGLSWCARSLCAADVAGAERLIVAARNLERSPELGIAEAVVAAAKGDHRGALAKLADLDSPCARTAALVAVARHEGKLAATEWLTAAGLSPADLDPEGRLVVLTIELDLAHWESAADIARMVTTDDMLAMPPLWHQVGIALLLTTLPENYREVVRYQLPLDLAEAPFDSVGRAVEDRRLARDHFRRAAAVAKELELTEATKIDETYAMWLGLSDVETRIDAKKCLEARFRDADSALHLVPLGIGFGISMDLSAVVKQIERQESLRGGVTSDSATARFALAFTEQYSDQCTEYIIEHFEALSEYVTTKAMRVLQLEWYLKKGRYEAASKCVEQLEQDGVTEAEIDRFRERVDETKGADLVEVRKARFEESDQLDDLVALVVDLREKENWDELCKYGAILYSRTRSVNHAEWLVSALANTNRMDEVQGFLKSHPDLLEQSRGLQMADAWSLYYEGELLKARTRLNSLHSAEEDTSYRMLKVRIAIALGDWYSLMDFVANELNNRNCRSAVELLSAAQLGYSVGSPHSRALLDAAIDSGNDNAEVLAGSYYLAVQADIESEVSVEMLQRSAALSQDDGPVRRVDFRGVVDVHTQWEKRGNQAWQLFRHGNLPMCVVAQLLNTSLFHMTIIPGFQNLDEADARRRRVIPAYSGRRITRRMELACSVAMDSTALLTLAFLDVLDTAFEALDSVWIPHCTMAWLFEERQRVAFHQPRMVREARAIRDLLARDRLRRFVSTSTADLDLVTEIGEELAELIAEAEAHYDCDKNVQHVVVRSAPVYLRSSLMEEEADLSAYTHILTSCVAVVDKLREKGQLTAADEQRAQSYLEQHEREWPGQPGISDCAVVYLDDLTTGYLLHLGLLDKLSACGLTAVVSSSTVRQTNELIAYESVSGKVSDVIERIRRAVEQGIVSGKVRIGRNDTTDDSEEMPISEHPTVAVTKLMSECDAIVVDDRFINQNENIQSESGGSTAVFTTLDLLSSLRSNHSISSEVFSEYLTLLRRTGYVFVPTSAMELSNQLASAPVKAKRLVETAELKAIRESLLSARMGDWLRLPEEESWLRNTMNTLGRVLINVWTTTADIAGAPIRADWLFSHMDIRGWTQSFSKDKHYSVEKIGPIVYYFMMLTPPSGATAQAKKRYWTWLEERVLKPMKEREPELYDVLLEVHRRHVAAVVDAVSSGES